MRYVTVAEQFSVNTQKKIKGLFIKALIFIFFILSPLFSFASIPSDDCLGCHEKYTGFNHGKTQCSSCHSDIASLPHGEKLKKPLCKTCHSKTEEAYQKSIHSKKKMNCKDCHDVHFLTKDKKTCVSCHSNVAHKRLPAPEKHLNNLNCLTCHGKPRHGEISIEINTGKKDIIKPSNIDKDRNGHIDHMEWDNMNAQLKREIKGKEEIKKNYSIKIEDPHLITKTYVTCKECHNDLAIFKKANIHIKGMKTYSIPADIRIFIHELPSIENYRHTVHGKKGVRCLDCHISEKKISDDTCIKCHEKLYSIYKDTAHSEKGATQCTDCHNPHLTRSYKELTLNERINICVRCHKDYLNKHKWLPNTVLHFRYLECTSCHSPGSTKSMLFNFVVRDEEKTKPIQYEDIKDIFGKDLTIGKIIDRDGDGMVYYDELIDFFNKIKNRLNKDLFIKSSILVTNPYHNFSQKNLKNKVCNECHSEDARFYNSMLISIPEKKGIVYMPVKKTILAAFPTSIFIDMCLLGEGKIRPAEIRAILKANWKDKPKLVNELGFKLIDFIGITISFIILGVIIIHIILRIVVKK